MESFESFENVTPGAKVEPFAEAVSLPTVRTYGFVRGEATVDTRFDSPPNVPFAENVAEFRARTALGIDVKLGAQWRLVLEGRGQLRLVTQRGFDRAKGFFEPTLADAFIDYTSSHFDLRVGSQRLVLGANAGLAPVESLNVRDLRESLLTAEPDEALLPVPAVRAQGVVGVVSWLVAYVPFFQPNRFFVVGQDEGVLQPALAPSFDTRRVDPSVEDFAQERFLETKRPPPFLGDLALRLRSTGRWKLGASWVWMNEKVPRVMVDREVQILASANATGRPIPQATATSLFNRFQAGENLFQGTYSRTHLLSVEGSTVLGSSQLDVDVTWTPRQTWLDAEVGPLDKSTLTWVVGLSQAAESKWLYSLSYLGIAVPSLGANEQLILLEPSTARGAARTAWFHLFTGSLGVTFGGDRWTAEIRGAFEPIGRSFAAAAKLSWQPMERLKASAGVEVYEGSSFSPFGYWSRNDRVWVSLRYELF
jgi:hypothetical protein